MALSVVILGRPNVGKSTLFNRLIGKRLALVDDTPGVTRDWRAAPAWLGGLSFTAIDTAGLEEAFDESLEARMRRQTERALARADVALLLIDARAGVTPLDHHFADWLRTLPIPVILVANKAEGRAGEAGMLEAYELGLGKPVAISAEHGEGMADLVEALLPHVSAEDGGMAEAADAGIVEDAGAPDVEVDVPSDPDVPEDAAAEPTVHDDGRPVRIVIVGRPNVGKSTLVNAVIGEERVLTGPEAGMTRDAIAVEWTWRDRPIMLVDTAGLRRRARVEAKLERLAVADALGAIRLAHVVVLLIDGLQGLDRQDLTIARHVIDEGRALVIGINKWDAVADKAETLRLVYDRLETSLPQVRGIPVVTVSALKGRRLDALFDAVLEVYRVWNTRVPTSRLNRWLAGMVAAHPLPMAYGRPVRLRFMTQVKIRPPTFALWASRPVALPESYLRYLVNGLREAFGLPAVPIRVNLRKGRNPYVGSS